MHCNLARRHAARNYYLLHEGYDELLATGSAGVLARRGNVARKNARATPKMGALPVAPNQSQSVCKGTSAAQG